MPHSEKQYYSWKEFDADVVALAEQITKADVALKTIYGIPRGGLILAVALSHYLDLPMRFDTEMIDDHTLVVDDICDKGTTFDRLCERTGKRPTFAALHYNADHDLAAPDFWVHKKEAWIVYPWETDASSKYDGTYSENETK